VELNHVVVTLQKVELNHVVSPQKVKLHKKKQVANLKLRKKKVFMLAWKMKTIIRLKLKMMGWKIFGRR
jgi:hypothetical protein